MNKKGFTLVELLAVIAILGVLVIIAGPNVIEMFNKGTDDSMTIVENNTLDAANLLVSDSCGRHAIGDKKQNCFDNRIAVEENKYYAFCASSIINTGYLPSINYKGNVPCDGIVLYKYDSDIGSYDEGKVFLKCGDYKTENDNVKSEFESDKTSITFKFKNNEQVVINSDTSDILSNCGIN